MLVLIVVTEVICFFEIHLYFKVAETIISKSKMALCWPLKLKTKKKSMEIASSRNTNWDGLAERD